MSPLDDARFQPASDQSLLVYLGETISLDTHHRVLKLLRLLESQPIPGVRNLHPAYTSLLVVFDALQLRHEDLAQILRGYLARTQETPLPKPRLVEIPVCYGGEFGPDLDNVAHMHELTPAQVIDLHASATYLVYFLGFAPGFAYLGGLPESLVTPRLASPRRAVPAGSVGIAGNQAGVYPFATPGGWQLIGRTPIAMFRPDRSQMNVLSIGDQVRFTPIPPDEFTRLADISAAGLRGIA
jgi:KipI family sensor histidine kinase inhibitor